MARGSSQSQTTSSAGGASRPATVGPRGSAAAAAGMRRRRVGGGGGGGGAGGFSGGGGSNMLRFYTDDAPGLKMSPTVVLVMSLCFIGSRSPIVKSQRGFNLGLVASRISSCRSEVIKSEERNNLGVDAKGIPRFCAVQSKANSVMSHQNWFYKHQMPEMDRDQLWNHYTSPRMWFENRPMVPPTEDVVRARNSTGCFNVPASIYDHGSSSSISEIPSHRPANREISHGFLHTPSAGNSSQLPPNYAHAPPQHRPLSCQHTVRDTGGRTNPQMENVRASYKRKSPAVHMISDQWTDSRYYGDGSCSLSISFNSSQPKAYSHSEYRPWDPIGRVPSHMVGNPGNVGEGFQRNVRSRYSHDSMLASNPAGGHIASNLPQHFLPVANVSSQSNYPPPVHQSILSSGRTNGFVGFDGRCHSNAISARHSSTPFPMCHTSAQSVPAGQNVFGQSTSGYTAMSSYQPTGVAATSEDNRWSGADAPYRHARPLSISEHRNERDGRVRSSYWRYNSSSCEESANRFRHRQFEGIMMDRSTFYEPNVFDEHWDMRLDIDNMSYEELLALEERIGNVSTGLSENSISSCLVEAKYSKQMRAGDDEDGKCAICLEEYEQEGHLGRLNCSHDFHFSCIKNWLLMKNVCPICKAPALADVTCKEK
ncbi:hypothetical protein J5N97_006034 [Dioscorea zingiberensis]|uniref:RING-type E3 ubiquitin transferase n=1 Tax=Dioscorea zingiberensis TaxID=325984 RepID=A0A9D5HSW4_9LILI|nr:hypothetical protein J5N97_006034 [Dioscorea zingiberensis]